MTNLASHLRFTRALEDPGLVQRQRLDGYLSRHAGTAFGRTHDFSSLRGYDEFVRRVPISDYQDLDPWIQRISRGENNVLTSGKVTRLIPTSGSTTARKLIPFTTELQGEFNAAIGPWLVDLRRQFPGIVHGPAYWSITPVTTFTEGELSVVPVGFDSDTAYLGGWRQMLADAVMAVPSALGQVRQVAQFRYLTLLCLLRQRDLRLISVWHPSFLSLLLEELSAEWEDLLADIRRGECKHAGDLPGEVVSALRWRPDPRLADKLGHAEPARPETIWPELKLISCWGDGAAEIPAARLGRKFPRTPMQRKGLLATEACVTLPFAGQHPIALCSHFFEFRDDAGSVFCADQLQEGREYEVIVTTGGGLWRYRLGDRVSVNGFVGRTPSLRFLGRNGHVSDLRGEKLSEAFVGEALRSVLSGLAQLPAFAFLAPDTADEHPNYTLYTDSPLEKRIGPAIDRLLRQNPHYAYCRDLGQLSDVRVFIIQEPAEEKFLARQVGRGTRLGDVKPLVFSRETGWSDFFRGRYL